MVCPTLAIAQMDNILFYFLRSSPVEYSPVEYTGYIPHQDIWRTSGSILIEANPVNKYLPSR